MKKIVLLAFVLVLLSTAMVGRFIRPIEASGTIYIKADGSVDPDTAPISSADNITYIFTDNINDSIVIQRDNIVVDGADYTLQGTGATGIDLTGRSNVTIKNMEIKACYWGIYIERSSNNTIYRNNIKNNDLGIVFWFLSNNTIVSGNNITENDVYGIWLRYSSNNSVYENKIKNNEDGIYLGRSSNNIVYGNDIEDNACGIRLYESSNNIVYYNNFLNNIEQVRSDNSTNVWDDGAGKGNYWSDYEERYPNATEIDGTGIWDTPYVIDENNQDNYPIVPEFPTLTPILLLLIMLTIATVIYKRRLLKTPIH